MQPAKNEMPTFQLKNRSYSPYTFQLRHIKPARKRPQWQKLLCYALLCIGFSIILGFPAINGLIFFFVILSICRPRRRSTLQPLSADRMNASAGGAIEATTEQPSQATPEQIGHAIRGAGGIINYINYRN